MSSRFNGSRTLLGAAIASLFSFPAFAQTPTPPADEPTASIVVTGTRVSNRSVLNTVAPVDVVSAETLRNAGVTELNQALSVALPSLNFPRPGLTDGTDTVRPATLRGLAPDQTLVLVNSKRLHASALINLNGTVGRGSSAADLNTIPSSMVKSVEVLREGASAQYGSDAIAGVVNVRMRTDRTGGEITGTYGARVTEYGFNPGTPLAGAGLNVPSSRKRTDGQTGTLSGWKGFELGDGGYLTIAGEYKDQRHTERSGYDVRQQYPLANGALDPRERTIERYNAWFGEPEVKQGTVFANAGYNLSGGVKLYGWAGYQNRDARSGATFRRALQDQNVLSIYPNGFLPIIAPNVDDINLAGGVTWTWNDWDMDASLSYGRNKVDYTVENTLNRSLGASSKTAFDAGGYDYDQTTFNLSATRQVPLAALSEPLNVSVGAEMRRESYAISAGEPDSYRFGGALLPSGLPTAPGAQGFPGFQPSDAADNSRTATGVYIDLETNLTKQLLASFAARAEHYSDFGNNLSGKLAARYDFSPGFALRGAIQNGFRAPSPQQQFFRSTSTVFIDGVPYDVVTFRPGEGAAAALGARPLDAEKSVNASLGAVFRADRFSLTVDAYRIRIKNRIVLSENLTADNVRLFLASRGFQGVSGGRFFINGVDTTTKGVDIVASLPVTTANAGRFDFTVAANFNDTEVTRLPSTAQLAALSPAPTLFGRVNTLVFEQGQPKNKLSASANWTMGKLGGTLRATRYGDTLAPGTSAALDFMMTPKTLVDLEARYALTSHVKLALGAENVFDQYPDALPVTLNTTGNTPFSNYSPFGRSGRFVYARASYSF